MHAVREARVSECGVVWVLEIREKEKEEQGLRTGYTNGSWTGLVSIGL
jgi:hypothetical protein